MAPTFGGPSPNRPLRSPESSSKNSPGIAVPNLRPQTPPLEGAPTQCIALSQNGFERAGQRRLLLSCRPTPVVVERVETLRRETDRPLRFQRGQTPSLQEASGHCDPFLRQPG